ncbi:MAG: glycosyltransferase [Phycisphaerales bacterium JB050]
MRFLLSSFGSAGDVRPLLSVGQALSHAGHEVVALLDPGWCAIAESEYALSATPTGEPWNAEAIASHPEWLDPKRGSVRMLRELVIPRTLQLVRDARRVSADFKPDAIIGHHISFGLPWVAQERDIPWIMGAVAPSSWPSIEDPNLYPGMPDRDRYPKWTIRLGTTIAGRVIDRSIDPAINAVRNELGLPPQRRTMLHAQFSDTLNLGLWSPHFRGPASDDPATTSIVGFPAPPTRSNALAPELAAAINATRASGGRLAVWSLGTTAAHLGRDLVESFLMVATELHLTPLILTGSQPHADELTSRGILAAPYAPHDALFPHADLVIHHGGIGTTASVLRAGVPSVAIPFTHDQPDNARRLRRLGVASVISPKQRNALTFKEHLQAAIQSAMETSTRSTASDLSNRVAADEFHTLLPRAIETALSRG